jgi:hypothetical protein
MHMGQWWHYKNTHTEHSFILLCSWPKNQVILNIDIHLILEEVVLLTLKVPKQSCEDPRINSLQ